MVASLVSSRPRGWILALALAAGAGIFFLRIAVTGPQYGVTLLFFLPVVVIAIEYGLIAGLVAGGCAVVLSQAALSISGEAVPLISYLSRAVGYMTVGAITGFMADRMRTATLDLREGARHFELSGDLLCTADLNGNLLHVNGAWQRALGWTREELLEHPFLELVHPDDRERTATESARAGETDRAVSFTNRYRAKDGGYRWLEWSSRVDHETCLVYAVARDITERREAIRSREEAQQRFRRIFDDSFAGIALVGMDGRIIEANRTLAGFLGYPPEQLVGAHTLTEFAEEEYMGPVAEGVEAVLAGERDAYRGQLQVRRKDGELIWADLTLSVIRDADGTPLYRLSQMLNIQAEKEAEAKLRHLADHDPLSGVFNRRRFEAELAREFEHEGQQARSAAVLLFDVDGFKQVNDSLGHGAGDAVIVRLGRSLERQVRTGDVVARLGGDEFAVLLRRIGRVDAERIADSIRDRARCELAETIDHAVPIGLSVGIATIEIGDETAQRVLARADAAMYEAKRGGGDRVLVGSAGPRSPLGPRG